MRIDFGRADAASACLSQDGRIEIWGHTKAGSCKFSITVPDALELIGDIKRLRALLDGSLARKKARSAK